MPRKEDPHQDKGTPRQKKGRGLRAGVKGGKCPPPSTGPRGPGGPRSGDWRTPRCGYFNVFAKKTAILTKNDTFRHANEGGPAPREGGPAPGEWGPAGAPRPLPPSRET